MSDIILATQSHELGNYESLTSDKRIAFLAQIFLDIDMSILASNPASYEIYAKQIEFEYSYLPEIDFLKGRTSFLESCVEKGTQIFKSPLFLDLNSVSLKNMADEVQRLKKRQVDLEAVVDL